MHSALSRFGRIRTTILFAIAFAICSGSSVNAQLSQQVWTAIEAARLGDATEGQKALLFMNNDKINNATLNGWIPDDHYQAVQAEYAKKNAELAGKAATDSNGIFDEQTRTSDTYSPGTDSDYIIELTGDDPVADIKGMQEKYNQNVNSYLEEALKKEGFDFESRNNWHNDLDVDFMADPKTVTDAQFRQIAELNNDAYKRKNAARYEATSRAKDGTKVQAAEFADYGSEMQDFANKKKGKIAQLRKNPSILKNPDKMAEFHRMMAQEQKYVSRIESATDLLRKQEGLPPLKQNVRSQFNVRLNKDGSMTIRKKPPGSTAKLGSVRSAANRNVTAAASAVADNSLNRAVSNLAESMADAAMKNPKKFPKAAAQIADLAERLPLSAKGDLLAKIDQASRKARLKNPNLTGPSFARDVASKMRERATQEIRKAPAIAAKDAIAKKQPVASSVARAKSAAKSAFAQLDNKIKTVFNVTDDLNELRGMRRTLNQKAASALGGLDNLSKVGTAVEVLDAANQARIYTQNILKATDPNTTDAEANEAFRQAEEAAWTMSKNGMLGAISEAVPTFGAIYGGWMIGNGGGRYILENTETGKRVDRWALAAANDFIAEKNKAADALAEYFGGESGRMRAENEKRDLEASYWRALRDGKIRMKPGVRTLDIAARIRNGDLQGIRDLIEPGKNASESMIAAMQPKKDEKPKATKPQAVKETPPNQEFISQTFEPGSDAEMRARLDALQRQGQSIVGKPQRFGTGTLPTTDTGTNLEPDSTYRSQASQLAQQINAAEASRVIIAQEEERQRQQQAQIAYQQQQAQAALNRQLAEEATNRARNSNTVGQTYNQGGMAAEILYNNDLNRSGRLLGTNQNMAGQLLGTDRNMTGQLLGTDQNMTGQILGTDRNMTGQLLHNNQNYSQQQTQQNYAEQQRQQQAYAQQQANAKRQQQAYAQQQQQAYAQRQQQAYARQQQQAYYDQQRQRQSYAQQQQSRQQRQQQIINGMQALSNALQQSQGGYGQQRFNQPSRPLTFDHPDGSIMGRDYNPNYRPPSIFDRR